MTGSGLLLNTLPLKRAQNFASEQKPRFWDHFEDFLPCFTGFQKAVNSQPVDEFFCSTPEMKARDTYVPFLIYKHDFTMIQD